MTEMRDEHVAFLASLRPTPINALKYREAGFVFWSRIIQHRFRNRHALRGRAQGRDNTRKDYTQHYD